MATAQWGLFEWGLAEWSDAEAVANPDLEASGTISFAGSASLQLTRTFDATGSISISGTAALTTVINMAAAANIAITGEATDFFVARFPGRLVQCGDPINTAYQDWMEVSLS